MSYKGKFKPKNPHKYKGNSDNIIYRSSWECKFMSKLDAREDVLEWASEEFSIKYISPVDGKAHRYFPDFYVKFKTTDGSTKIFVIEIKPHKQVEEPKKRTRVTRQYINEVTTYAINQAKWKAAKEFCKDNGFEFQIMTEHHLGII